MATKTPTLELPFAHATLRRKGSFSLDRDVKQLLGALSEFQEPGEL
jgi:hypothetical protein